MIRGTTAADLAGSGLSAGHVLGDAQAVVESLPHLDWRSVESLEEQAVRGHLVEVGRLDVVSYAKAVPADLPPALVVAHREHDVREARHASDGLRVARPDGVRRVAWIRDGPIQLPSFIS